MKNVEELVSTRSSFRVRIKGAPPPTGWAVRYLSGMEESPAIRAGYWLTQWDIIGDKTEATFRFEPEMHMCFDKESVANDISAALRKASEIETEVVKVGA